MLKITKYYKTIFLGFIQNSLISQESQSIIDRFSQVDNKESFIGDNLKEITTYLNTLNMDKNGDQKIDKQFLQNPKLAELFIKLGITKVQLEHGITLSELKNKLNEYKKIVVETIGVTRIETNKLKEVINVDTILQSKVSLKKGIESYAVQALQKFLIKKGFLIGKADSKFGKLTEKALKNYQKAQGFKVIDGILTVKKGKNGKYFSTMQSILDSEGFSPSVISDRSANKQEVFNKLNTTNKSIDANINMLEKSKKFYDALEAREDGGNRNDILSDTGSILGLLREVFGANKASEYFKKIKSYEKNLQDPNMQEKFNKGYEFLTKNSSTRNDSLISYGFRDIIMVILAKIPLFDVRLNFAKRLNKSGIDMNRATIFSTWIESGMKQDFKDYEKTTGKTIDNGNIIDKDLNSLKGTITAYITSNHADKIKNVKITKELVAQLRKTDSKLDNMINTYISDRFIPDAETLLSGGFNVFEYFFDEKYNKIKELINELKGGEIKLNTKNKAKKEKSSSDKFQDVFLLKNNGKFYLHIGSEYKEFTNKKPSSEEIESSILEYNKLSLITHGKIKLKKSSKKYLSYSIKGKKIIAEAKRKGIKPDLTIPEKENNSWYRLNLDNNKNEIYQSKKERLNIAHKIIDEFKKQNTKSEDNRVGEGKLDGHIKPVENRLEYYGILNNKNSKFLKEAIQILKSEKGITDEVRKNFGIINFYNTTTDFLNAYSALPKEVKQKMKKLDNSNLTTQEYISKLNDLSNDLDVKKALTAIKSGTDSYKSYRLANLESRLHTVPKNHRIDAGKFKYGARMLTKEEFNMPYIILQAEYKNRFDNKIKSQHFKQEFKDPKTFKDIYSFDKPATYEEYLNKLSQTGPNIPDEIDGKYWSTMDLHERGLIEAGVLDVTGEQLNNNLKTKGEAVDIQDYFKDPKDFVNTARQAGYRYDLYTTFEKLAANRGDKKIIHTTIDRSFSFTTKTGENITTNMTYDVFMRPECENIYVLPNAKSIQKTITYLQTNNAISILNTPTIPIFPSMFNSFFKNGGNGGTGGTGGLNGNGNSNANGGRAVGPGNAAGKLL